MIFSIITTCYQARDCIKETIESVLSQDFLDFEYVIKDGGSADGTLEIIKGYEDAFRRKGISLKVVSEKDGGIYQGMNAGVALARGEYVNFMNAGDCFFDGQVLRSVYENVLKDAPEAADVIYGDAAEFECGNYYYFSKDFSSIRKRMPFSHQSVFAKRELLQKYPFNAAYRIAADYDFLLNCHDTGAKFADSEVLIATVSKDGLSSVDLYHTFTETEEMLNTHGIFRFTKAQLKKKLFFLRIRQFGMDHLPMWVKNQIRLVQRKQRGQDRQVSMQ